MLIAQMKEHPEEFRGYAGKFTAILDKAREAIDGLHRNVWMSKRDAEAILAAAETHLYEVWLAEDVLTAIMQPKEQVAEAERAYTVGRGKVALPSAIYAGHNTANIASNTSTSQYIEQAYQMERAKYQMELEKLRQQDNEFAMRLTKPFKDFI
jgi:hypothetical protein